MDKLIPYNFTTYSLTWMPEKIETQSITEFAWSNDEWRDVLTLNFECESKMLLLIFAHSHVWTGHSDTYGRLKLTIDSTDLPETEMQIEIHVLSLRTSYAVHSVAILERGNHNLHLKIKRDGGTSAFYVQQRRITILKGFYKGGAT